MGNWFNTFVNSPDGTVTLNNVNVHADVVKVAALGSNGVLTIGGGSINAIACTLRAGPRKKSSVPPRRRGVVGRGACPLSDYCAALQFGSRHQVSGKKPEVDVTAGWRIRVQRATQSSE